MSTTNRTIGLSTEAFRLTWMSVPIFNLVKYVIMTYLIGFVWDSAYVRVIETKRYLSLWYTGQFSAATWGRSRNNLFSGSNFEILHTALSRLLGFSKQGEADGIETSANTTEGSLISLRCLLFEVFSIGLILAIVFAEAASELFTDNVENTTLAFGFRNSTVRQKSSEVVLDSIAFGRHPDTVYFQASDIMFSRRCTQYEAGRTFVTKPNLIVESTIPIPHSGDLIPVYNMKLMCLYDENDKESRIEVIHTLHETQQNDTIYNGTRDYSTIDLKKKTYTTGFAKVIAVPHFSEIPPTAGAELQVPRLLLLELDGNNFTCSITWRNGDTWCVRVEGSDYEIVYLDRSLRSSGGSGLDLIYNSSKHGVEIYRPESVRGVLPFRVSLKTLPLLAHDRFMKTPPLEDWKIGSMENVISSLAVGYAYGWATEGMKNQSVIIGRRTEIVPNVQIGYIVALSTILLCSVLVLVVHAVISRNRKISGLIGEQAFIDRWHGHLQRDGLCDRIQRRSTVVVFRSLQGVGRLQPPVGLHASPLSGVEFIMGGHTALTDSS